MFAGEAFEEAEVEGEVDEFALGGAEADVAEGGVFLEVFVVGVGGCGGGVVARGVGEVDFDEDGEGFAVVADFGGAVGEGLVGFGGDGGGGGVTGVLGEVVVEFLEVGGEGALVDGDGVHAEELTTEAQRHGGKRRGGMKKGRGLALAREWFGKREGG